MARSLPAGIARCPRIPPFRIAVGGGVLLTRPFGFALVAVNTLDFDITNYIRSSVHRTFVRHKVYYTSCTPGQDKTENTFGCVLRNFSKERVLRLVAKKMRVYYAFFGQIYLLVKKGRAI